MYVINAISEDLPKAGFSCKSRREENTPPMAPATPYEKRKISDGQSIFCWAINYMFLMSSLRSQHQPANRISKTQDQTLPALRQTGRNAIDLRMSCRRPVEFGNGIQALKTSVSVPRMRIL